MGENGKLPQHTYERSRQNEQSNKHYEENKDRKDEEKEEEEQKKLEEEEEKEKEEETHEAISSLLSAEYVTEKAQKWSFCCGRRSSE